MSGSVEALEHLLLLLSIGVPCWVLTAVFGRNDMYWYRHLEYWYRHLERLGCNSLVGTTVTILSQLPAHLVSDETHLTEAFGVFAAEAKAIAPNCAPKPVNTDSWWATTNTFVSLFPGIVTILCFLHGFLKIRNRSRKAYDLHQQVWAAYQAETAEAFQQQMRWLKTWIENITWSATVIEMVAKFWKRADQYLPSYQHPGCPRTSNLVDRLMNRLTRLLYQGRGLHGHQLSSELRLRG